MIPGKHIPVLLSEVVDGLNLKSGSVVIDATVDGGGHAMEILKKLGQEGKLIGLDWDLSMIEKLRSELSGEGRVKLFHSNFSEMEKVAGPFRPDAILFDLGLSSLQLLASGRGFSFKSEDGLGMTFDFNQKPNAEEFIRTANVKDLEEVIRKYGEERFAGRIARAIERYRAKKRIASAKELAEVISRVVPRRGRINPATRTFQSLRIYLNHELENIEIGLTGAWKIIKPEGRIAVISYHSLEDRIIKNFFKEKAKSEEGKLINKKPIIPGREEILKNPRSRSAKLRIIEKI
ncbi:16S rRNA (cytosine(1402)-N(4))-methyltransferase [Candidatus Giovannonibacteria bacterium RIFCSPLOWO2_02_FULL_45_14]|uniref:Ribosomal RNA small subunit methyltransferase H n=1 Tax=Candidatus Giovannonibacteria bacterium RIFCSPLOWO2_12_FULL_44_15 TaxID=1798364 RepID=A0A1F5XZ76_9BACT|nr:MAG: 16S rRNA (cytosine(1402)-N(4))-methyltransferase [Candidatus Giovannonibacteria bacterium RIFCSPHIGHO2_02_FULL_44_31]OGF77088.1 MAG: 16S rRNA (cytosine(1402)-N(4))-methyltransferase [Candidatus Giovannonibacteria bacterium RIFCSPHIGHO2_12_FULL_44_29]OGF90841.1 MAG: 16S rRNA (cytosine(1402)-N(4))-methyltransferase [Candidatus Giovannonibacteria bacterium RIFCSPLOWO2_02_FULL_45_14]OGF93267.1 MAG: 16S rRNA (cytosine(1402)-N(4))-methyltransferase [Candidatus Giovannonibacteria bacterium RIFC